MEYEKELRESGNYTELEIQGKMLINCLKTKLIKHHELYRFPVKAELWEDIWDQCINPNGSKWIGGGHQSGADTHDESSNISYQNKSGQIDGDYVKITSHRTKKHPSFEEKLNLYGYLDMHKENYKDKLLVTNLNYYKVEEGFPCILKNNLEIGVIDVSFSIELFSCEKFKCKFDFIA